MNDTQPKSGEDIPALSIDTTEQGQMRRELSQLRAERDEAFGVNKTMGDAIERLARRFGATSEDAAFVVEVVFGAFADLTAERDRLKEENEKGKSAMKTMSELFSVTSRKCGTLESDNARLAAEVETERNANMRLAERNAAMTKQILEMGETRESLTAELEAAKGERDHWIKTYEIITTTLMEVFGLKCLPMQTVRFAEEKYLALAAKVRELREVLELIVFYYDKWNAEMPLPDNWPKHEEGSPKSLARISAEALLSTPPDEGEKEPATWESVDALINEYVEGYEMVGEDEQGRDGCYSPTESEQALIKDAIAGLLAETEFIKAISAALAGDEVRRHSTPPNPEGAGEPSAGTIMGEQIRQAHQARKRIAPNCWNCPECGGILRSDHVTNGKYCWACRKGFSEELPPIPRPDDTQGGEKEYRMLEPRKDVLQPGDEDNICGYWSHIVPSYVGVEVWETFGFSFRRPITPPTETGGVE